MTSLNSTPDEPFDPFDRESLLYSAAEVTHGEIDAKHELTAIQLRKPIRRNRMVQDAPGCRLHLAGCDVRQGGRKR